MKTNPSINDFFELTDPEFKIDRLKIISEIGLVVLMEVTERLFPFLGKGDIAKINELINNNAADAPEQLVEILIKSAGQEKLFETAEQVTEEIRLDYFKTQFKNLNITKKSVVEAKYPGINKI